MTGAAKAFSWWPKVDLWPLFTVCGAAVGICAWSSFRHLSTNPDVHLTGAHRMDGAAEEGTTLRRAQGYYNSVFRAAHQLRSAEGAETLGRVDTRIFR